MTVTKFLPIKLAGLLVAMACAGLQAGEVDGPFAVNPQAAVDPDLGLRLPAGFTATVFADLGGYARQLAVRDDGSVYLSMTVRMGRGSTKGVFALRDSDGDHVADVIEHFAGDTAGTGLRFHQGDLYFAGNTEIYRYQFSGTELVPSAPPEVVVAGFPEQRVHADKTFTIDDQNNLYVNVGAPSNACMEQFRTRGSPGQMPCPQLEMQAGLWRFRADGSGQTQAGGERFATGIRNAIAMQWSEQHRQLYFLTHGRDALFLLFPEYFSAEQSSVLPAEEMHVAVAGGNYGWPYSYYDQQQGRRMLAPEYGGDGKQGVEQGLYREPIATFPGHWAPNDLLFYNGSQFPQHFRNGAFIVFHGSWNRAPLPQDGYKVVFLPFQGSLPGPDWEVFADGFKGVERLENPADARHRPTGIAQGPQGELYLSSSNSGRIWRIDYSGE
jgi:glucose/arabinose dehydrogenase